MLKIIFDTGKNAVEDFSPQQKVILQQKQNALDMADKANEMLDDKAW